MKHLQESIKKHRKEKGYTQQSLAKSLNVTKNSVSNWENGVSTPPLETLVLMSNIFVLSLDMLVHGKSINSDSMLPKSEKNKKNRNLFVPIKARAGYLEGWNDEDLHKELEPIHIPGLPDNREARTFEIEGMSMFPIICTGDLLVCTKVEVTDEFRDDNVYVIITRLNGILVKFVHGIEPALKLVSLNKSFQNILIDLEDIREIWKARFKITRNFAAGTSEEKSNLQDRVERLEDLIREKLG